MSISNECILNPGFWSRAGPPGAFEATSGSAAAVAAALLHSLSGKGLAQRPLRGGRRCWRVSSWQHMGLGSETAHQRRSETGCTQTLVKLNVNICPKGERKSVAGLESRVPPLQLLRMFVQGRITLQRASDQIQRVLVATVMDKKQHSSNYGTSELTVTCFWNAACCHFLFIPTRGCFFSEDRDLNVGIIVAQQRAAEATSEPATCAGILQCIGKRAVLVTGCLVYLMTRGMRETLLFVTNMSTGIAAEDPSQLGFNSSKLHWV